MARTGAASVVLTLLAVLVGVALAAPAGPPLTIKPEAVYFPDQVEYIRAAKGKCSTPPELLFWPGDRRCYEEGSQGPCSFEYRLVWDERQLRPRCERDNNL